MVAELLVTQLKSEFTQLHLLKFLCKSMIIFLGDIEENKSGSFFYRNTLQTYALIKVHFKDSIISNIANEQQPEKKDVAEHCVTSTFTERNRLALSLSGNEPLIAN